MKKALIVLSLWITCGIISAGFNNAYFARKYNMCDGRGELAWAIGYGIGGPFSLFIALIGSGFGEYGWSLYILNDPSCQPKTFKY